MVSCSVSCVSNKKGRNSFTNVLPLMSVVSAVLMVLSDVFSNTGIFGSPVVDLMVPAMIFVLSPSGTTPKRPVVIFSSLITALAIFISCARVVTIEESSLECALSFTNYVPALLASVMLLFLCVGSRTEAGNEDIKEIHLAVFFVLLLGAVYCNISQFAPVMAVLTAISVVFYLYLCASTVRSSMKGRRIPAAEAGIPGPAKSAAVRKGHLDDIYKRLQDLFDTDKPYLDENITVGEIAKKLYTNKAYLSRVINDHTGKNFCQYVNYYRVMYSIQAFKENPGLRVYELAEMSGFHTIVSYNMAFRLVTNETPSEWCKRVRSETDVKGVRRV